MTDGKEWKVETLRSVDRTVATVSTLPDEMKALILNKAGGNQ